MVNKCIFHTNDYYAYVNAHLTENSNRNGFELYECLIVSTMCTAVDVLSKMSTVNKHL